ncbi:hypothetical protein HAX54_006533 [Datura stramonium]|uniref:AP2/ERF domain-containing protein n=1 Tax=Datura stramonium TaxID=4076 RepID=A0ABS8RV85_DATST|nr:hypothetical protein [Datura stramonium]
MNNNSSSYSSDFNPLSAIASDEEAGTLLLASSQPKKRAGRKKFKETRHPIYRGVRRRNNNKWVCELREPTEQKRIWLGTYPTPEMAARAHDVAALALRGNQATLNFADSRWRLSVPISNDPEVLRQAAMQAAETFRQDHTELIGVDCMNNDVGGGGASGSSGNNLVGEELNNIQNMGMDSNLCCNWGDNNEMLEIEGSSWQEKMAEGLLYSPTTRLGSCFSWDDDVESDVEVSLWSYNF